MREGEDPCDLSEWAGQAYLLTSKIRSVFRVWLPTPPGSPQGCTVPTGKAGKSVWAGGRQGFPQNRKEQPTVPVPRLLRNIPEGQRADAPQPH